jgi:hypothetical protein
MDAHAQAHAAFFHPERAAGTGAKHDHEKRQRSPGRQDTVWPTITRAAGGRSGYGGSVAVALVQSAGCES